MDATKAYNLCLKERPKMHRHIPTFLFLAFFLMQGGFVCRLHAQQLTEEEIEQFKQDFESVKGMMEQAQEKTEALKEKLAAFKKYMKEDASKDIKKAAKIFNISAGTEKELKNKVAEIHYALITSGISGKLENALEKLEKANKFAKSASDVFKFAEKWDPKNARKKPTGGLRRIAEILESISGAAEPFPLLKQMVGMYAEISTAFADKLDVLEETLKKFRQGNLCAVSSMYKEEQACFAAAKFDDDCASYFEWEMFPELRPATVFEHAEYKKYFFYMGGECLTVNGGDFDQCYKYSMLLFDEGQKPDEFFVSQFAVRIKNWGEKQNKLIEEAKKHYNNILKLKADSVKPILKFLGYVDEDYAYSAPYDTFVKMDADRFTAHYLFKAQVRTDMQKLREDYESHVFLYGSVQDFDNSKAKPANVTVSVEGTPAVIKEGKYYAVVKKNASGAYRFQAQADGYEKFDKSYPSMGKSKSQIIYFRKPKPKDIVKKPDKQPAKQKEPSGFTGIEITNKFEGLSRTETPYVNGKKHGTQKIYNSEGKIKYETPYVNDKIHGLRKEYHTLGTYTLSGEEPWVNGVIHGIVKSYSTEGELEREIPYVNGKIHGVKKYYDYDGNVYQEDYYENDKVVKIRRRFGGEWKESTFQ